MTNGHAPVSLCGQTVMFLLGYDPFFGRQIFSRNSCVSEPRLHSNPFITKKQLNPSRFGSNKNYKLIDTLLLFALCNKHDRVFSMQRDCSP